MIIAQYLEPSDASKTFDLGEVRQRLRTALSLLPIDGLAIGWNLAQQIVDACADEAARAGITFYRWQPLLTDDGELAPQPEWQTIGLTGRPVPGFQGMPEFTFICPNHPVARAAVLQRIQTICDSAHYQGIFLDRIRFPSPAENPIDSLACFCDACHAAAATQGIDLTTIQQQIATMANNRQRAGDYVAQLLAAPGNAATPEAQAIETLLAFRTASITALIQDVATLCHAEGHVVGLDCFSPALARMVGQDLVGLAPYAEWTKIMSYGHTLGPAGLPFELLGLARWLMHYAGIAEHTALQQVGASIGIQLPNTLHSLQTTGITATDLAAEVKRGLAANARPLLFGIELVDLPGITTLGVEQIAADLRAIRQAGVDGLALSWDLWHIAPERLQLVRDLWFQRENTPQ